MQINNRVISYVDGFNLYFGLRDKGWRKYYWLDLVKMTRALLKPDQSFEHCHYFTAKILNTPGSQDADRQQLWLKALGTRKGISCHLGQYRALRRQCKSCGSDWLTHEEKMTDVNIATRLIVDAYDDRYDTAIIVSGDSDLNTPIQHLIQRFPQKRLIVAFPPQRVSKTLKKTSRRYVVIGENKLRQNLLPDKITTSAGDVLKRPPKWY